MDSASIALDPVQKAAAPLAIAMERFANKAYRMDLMESDFMAMLGCFCSYRALMWQGNRNYDAWPVMTQVWGKMTRPSPGRFRYQSVSVEICTLYCVVISGEK